MSVSLKGREPKKEEKMETGLLVASEVRGMQKQIEKKSKRKRKDMESKKKELNNHTFNLLSAM